MSKSEPIASVRKMPKQERARRTFDLIVETAAQLLLEEGETRLTTNRVAERGGFSIGTIYQYFPNREAILLALIERERERGRLGVLASLKQIKPETVEENVRQIVRSLIESFVAHRRARAVFILMILRLAVRRGVPTQIEFIATMIVDAWKDAYGPDVGDIGEADVFVLTRAVLGALRSAILEESPLLGTPAYEDALVKLIMGFMARTLAPA